MRLALEQLLLRYLLKERELPTQVPSLSCPALMCSHLPAAPEAGPAQTLLQCPCVSEALLQHHLPGTSTMQTPGTLGEPNLLGQDCVVLSIPITWKLTHCSPANQSTPTSANMAGGPGRHPGFLHQRPSLDYYDPRVY